MRHDLPEEIPNGRVRQAPRSAPPLPPSPMERHREELSKQQADHRQPNIPRDRRNRSPHPKRPRETQHPPVPHERPTSHRPGRDSIPQQVVGLSLREEERKVLAEAGRFRVVTVRDLSETVYGNRASQMKRDLAFLREKGLVQTDSVNARRDGRGGKVDRIEVVILTKEGRRVARQTSGLPQDQQLYSGLVKPREVEHDAQIYRAYPKEAERIEQKGGTNLRVKLDFELKSDVQKAIYAERKANAERDMADIKRQIAKDFDLPYVNSSIQIPDARIVYDLPPKNEQDFDQGTQSGHEDIEVLTAAYRPGHLRAKSQAGFRAYASSADRAGITAKIEDGHYLIENIGGPSDSNPLFLNQLATTATYAPLEPIIIPGGVGLQASQTQLFTAYAANSNGQITAALAPVTWSFAKLPAYGSLATLSASTALYTAPNYVATNLETDLVKATGVASQSASASGSATSLVTLSKPPPSPTIAFGLGENGVCGNPANGSQLNVSIQVGQLVQITGCSLNAVAAAGATLSWTPSVPNAATAVGLFGTDNILNQQGVTTSVTETVTAVSPTICPYGLYCDYNSFYFTYPGIYTFSLTYPPGVYGEGAPIPATVTFNVSGPIPASEWSSAILIQTGNLPASNGALVQTGSPVIVSSNAGLLLSSAAATLTVPYTAAMSVRVPAQDASLNGGTYEWAQIINKNTALSLMATGPSLVDNGEGLDSQFPLDTLSDGSYNDTPANGLHGSGYQGAATLYELTRNTLFTTYLLWEPDSQATCNIGGNLPCTIPVPIASVTWRLAESAYNTLDPTQPTNSSQGLDGWVVENCSAVTNGIVVPSGGTASYPVWTHTVVNVY